MWDNGRLLLIMFNCAGAPIRCRLDFGKYACKSFWKLSPSMFIGYTFLFDSQSLHQRVFYLLSTCEVKLIKSDFDLPLHIISKTWKFVHKNYFRLEFFIYLLCKVDLIKSHFDFSLYIISKTWKSFYKEHIQLEFLITFYSC